MIGIGDPNCNCDQCQAYRKQMNSYSTRKQPTYSQYGWYEIRKDDDEGYLFWTGGTLDDKGEDRLNRGESIRFSPSALPVGTKIFISVPVNGEGQANWPGFEEFWDDDLP